MKWKKVLDYSSRVALETAPYNLSSHQTNLTKNEPEKKPEKKPSFIPV